MGAAHGDAVIGVAMSMHDKYHSAYCCVHRMSYILRQNSGITTPDCAVANTSEIYVAVSDQDASVQQVRVWKTIILFVPIWLPQLSEPMWAVCVCAVPHG